jgi:FtsZ-binding cell division protein ZapB
MRSARSVLQLELDQLVQRRDHCVQAARTMRHRETALRHLLDAEQLVEEIQAIQDALEKLPVGEDDVTAPIRLSDGPDRPSVSPKTRATDRS